MTTYYKGSFHGCAWCNGTGCNQCRFERQKHRAKLEAEIKSPQPIFSADINNPDEMQLMKDFLGREALEHAFGPDGDGMDEIHRNAAIASFTQAMRNHNARSTEDNQ